MGYKPPDFSENDDGIKALEDLISTTVNRVVKLKDKNKKLRQEMEKNHTDSQKLTVEVIEKGEVLRELKRPREEFELYERSLREWIGELRAIKLIPEDSKMVNEQLRIIRRRVEELFVKEEGSISFIQDEEGTLSDEDKCFLTEKVVRSTGLTPDMADGFYQTHEIGR